MVVMLSDDETDYLNHVTAVEYYGVDGGGEVTINPFPNF